MVEKGGDSSDARMTSAMEKLSGPISSRSLRVSAASLCLGSISAGGTGLVSSSSRSGKSSSVQVLSMVVAV